MPNPHFPGSFPCASAEEVFTWVGRTLGDRAHLVPDGETDEQRRGWQPFLPWFERNETLDRGEDLAFEGEADQPQYLVKPDVTPVFDEPFEYQDWARDSYAVFKRVRDAGILPSSARFMVAMPHTVDSVMSVAAPGSFLAIYEAYRKQFEISMQTILDEIPHQDLAFQWDLVSLPLWDSGVGEMLGFSREFLLQEIAGHADLVPDDVEVGFHLCFGDGNNPEHTADVRPDEELPPDTSTLVPMANDTVKAPKRQVSFIHLATYQNWREASQYEPLQGLALDGTDLSLGVITLRRDPDVAIGVEHARQRTAAAREAIGNTFGISTTCGMGRFTPEQFGAATMLFDELQPH